MAHALSVYDIVLCVYERFRVDGWKRYVNDDRFRVDGDKKYAFTSVYVYNRLRVNGALFILKHDGNVHVYSVYILRALSTDRVIKL